MPIDALISNLVRRVNVGDSLTRSAERCPRGLAVVEGTRRLTYAEFNSLVNRVSHSLIARHVEVGDAVALVSGNSIEFLATYYACAKIGAVCVPINLDWRGDEIAFVLNDSGARVVVVQDALAGTLPEPLAAARAVQLVVVIGGSVDTVGDRPAVAFADLAAAEPDSEPERLIGDRAPLTYLYTSGTTSTPKGVVGTHTAVYLESMTMVIEGRFAPDDRFAAMLPMFHTAQLNCHCTTAIMVGATLHILSGFDAEQLLTLIEAESITQLFGLPSMYRAMLEHDSITRRNLSSVRGALYAMAPMPQQILQRCIEVFDCDFYLLFGQTEMSPTATIFRPENQLTHPGAVGTPVVNVQVAIMDDEGKRLPPHAVGEIVYRGPHVMAEYLGQPDATDDAFRGGWFHSGDIGYFDNDGILWFTDRSKDVIKTGGENVASIEVEKALYAAEPHAADVAVIGLPHPRWSEAVTAFVVAKPGARLDPESIRLAMRGHIDAYKIPKAVVVVDKLPKTATGKTQKHSLRAAHAGLYPQ